MKLVTKSKEPRGHKALVTRSDPKTRLDTKVIDFAELCLLAIIIKMNLQRQRSCCFFLFGILPVQKIN